MSYSSAILKVWRKNQEVGPGSVPTASLCGQVHTRPLAASSLGVAACNTKGVCGFGCVGGFPGPPACCPHPTHTPSGTELPSQLSTTLWGLA